MNLKVLFDPLYGAVPFKVHRLGVDDFFYDVSVLSDSEMEKLEEIDKYAHHFSAILKTFEFWRLNYLRQAGFSWLIYPSATHTRYAHSLGCWYLAEAALECVKVREEQAPRTQTKFLKRWLEGEDLIEEFLLSLLLHDVGHFPFSHVFEVNPSLPQISHEQVGAQLIRGEGEFFRKFKEITLRDTAPGVRCPRNVEFLSEALRKLKQVDVDVISCLITKDLSYIKDKKPRVQKAIPVMLELVSGLIDLDRIDHYHRDSHFMGLKVATVSPIALLANMVIVPVTSSSPPSARIELEDDAIMQMFSLLESKETLKEYVFDHEYNVAYSAMLNEAVSCFLDEHPEQANELLLLTDCRLLDFLMQKGNSKVTKLIKRVLVGSPYVRVGRYPVLAPAKRNLDWINELRSCLFAYAEVELGLEVDKTDIIMFYAKQYLSNNRTSPDDWFTFRELYDFRGEPLLGLDRHRRRIEYFRESLQKEKEAPVLEIFASNFTLKQHITKKLKAEDYF